MEKTRVKQRKRSQWLDVWARLRKNKVFMACLIIILILVLSCALANVIAPYDPAQFSTGDRFESSSLQQNVLRKKMHSKNTAHLCGVFVFAKENREKYSEKVTRRESDSHFSKNRTFGDAERQKVTRTPPLSAQRPPAARQIIWRTAGGLFVCRTSCPLCRACFLFPLVPLYFPDIRDGPDGTSVL